MSENELEQAWNRLAAEPGSDDVARLVWQQGQALRDGDGTRRRERANDALILYHGSGRYQFDQMASLAEEFGLLEPPGYNIVQAAVDTVTANIVRNKVRPMFVSELGDSTLKEKALGMQRAVESFFFECGLFSDVGMQICRHGNLFEGAGLKIIPDYANHRLLGELVPAHEIQVSPTEAQFGSPRQMWHTRVIDRQVLLGQFDDDEKAQEAIRAAKPAASSRTRRDSLDGDTVSDMVEVVEYWHLPSVYVDRSEPRVFGLNEDGDLDPDVDPEHDGRRIICIEGATLLDEPWPFDYFPIALFRPMRTAVGFWSTGIPERLAGAQILLNRLNDRIDRIIHMHAVPRLLVWKQAAINPAKITNDVASILETRVPPGQAAMYLVPQSVPAELFRRCEEIIRWAEKQLGLSEMAISAKKPAGVDHAPGMQHLADTESVRHTPAFRAWEDFHVQAARIAVDGFRLLAEHDPDFEIVFGDSKQLKRIRWKDVDLGVDRYHLRVWPTNLLPQTPSARKSYVIDMMNAGLFTREQALLGLEFPDIEAIMGDSTALQENVERTIEMAANGESVTPEPYMALEMLLRACVVRINRMQADGESEERIDPVRQLWEDTQQLLVAQAAPPPEGSPPAPSPPPEAPPTAA